MPGHGAAAELAEDLAGWWQPDWGPLEPVDDLRCRLEAADDSYAAIAANLLFSGLEFEIVEPPELQEEVRRMGARARQAVQRSRSPGEGADPAR